MKQSIFNHFFPIKKAVSYGSTEFSQCKGSQTQGLWEFENGPWGVVYPGVSWDGPSASPVTTQPKDRWWLTIDLLAFWLIICHSIIPIDFWDPSITRRQPAAGAKSFSKIYRRKWRVCLIQREVLKNLKADK